MNRDVKKIRKRLKDLVNKTVEVPNFNGGLRGTLKYHQDTKKDCDNNSLPQGYYVTQNKKIKIRLDINNIYFIEKNEIYLQNGTI